jgi:hypothetical protein
MTDKVILSAFLMNRHISLAVTGIRVDLATMVVSVSGDLFSLIPGMLAFWGQLILEISLYY